MPLKGTRIVPAGWHHLRQPAVAAFIDTAPVEVILTPRVKTTTTTGGQTYSDGLDRPAQVFRLVAQATAPPPVVVVDGVERVITYHLVGTADAVVDVGDRWSDTLGDWEVVAVVTDRGYETRAHVSRRLPARRADLP